MPFQWKRGANPYLHNYFGRLRIGPYATPPQIVERAKQVLQTLAQKQAAGERLEVDGMELDEHAISEASTKLRDPGPLAQELLLMHPQPQGDDKKLKPLAESLRKAASLPAERHPLALPHPAAIFWLTPAPAAEAAELPEWSAFALVGPQDEADLELDIVFDS